jgi:hypothetical protein
VLAEEGGPFCFGGMYEMLPGLLAALDRLADAFRAGGGVPQSAYDDRMWEGQ